MSRTTTPPPPWLPALTRLARTAGLLAAMLVAAAVLSRAAFAVVHVVLQSHVLGRDITQLEQERARLLATKAEKEQKIQWMYSPEGAEYLGRTNGMVKPGEHRVTILVQSPKPSATPAPSARLSRSEQLGVFATLGVVLLGLGLGAWYFVQRRRALAGRPANLLRSRSELRRHPPTAPLSMP